MQNKEELIESVLQLSDNAFRELLPILPKEWLQLDLTMPQLKVALLLFMNGPDRMSTIASSLGVSLATATGVVDRLVERGVVEREDDPSDRRVVICHLTAEGEKMISGLWQLARARSGELLRGMALDELGLLKQGLEALVRAGETTKAEVESDTLPKRR